MHIVTSHPIWAHDSNYSFFDGERLYYLKLERLFEQKHFLAPPRPFTHDLELQNHILIKLLIKNKHGIEIKKISHENQTNSMIAVAT